MSKQHVKADFDAHFARMQMIDVGSGLIGILLMSVAIVGILHFTFAKPATVATAESRPTVVSLTCLPPKPQKLKIDVKGLVPIDKR
jgi:hypothetical protein